MVKHQNGYAWARYQRQGDKEHPNSTFRKAEMHLHDSVVNETRFYTCPYRPLRRPTHNLYASERAVDRTLMYVL